MEQTSSSRDRRIGNADDASTTARRREDATSRRSAVRRGSSVRCRAPDRRRVTVVDEQMTGGARHGDRPTEESRRHRGYRQLVVQEIMAASAVVVQRALDQLLYLRAVPRQAQSRSRMLDDRNQVTQYLNRYWPSYGQRTAYRNNRHTPLHPVRVEPERVLWHPRLHTPEWIESQSRPPKCHEHDTRGHRCYITRPLTITVIPNKILF